MYIIHWGGAVVRVIAAGVLAGILIESGAAEKIAETIVEKMGEKKVLLAIALASMIITAVVLLALNPIGSILHIKFLTELKIDAMFILPIAGLVGLIEIGKVSKVIEYTTSGLNRMTGTVMILIGAGAIAGVISKSNLSQVVVSGIHSLGISGVFLAPIAGILMAAATASTSTGAIVATGTFSKAILSMGVAPLSAAVMINTGAVVIDHLPHGNFFHASADAVKMNIKERMKLIPYESIVGGSMAIAATIIYGLL